MTEEEWLKCGVPAEMLKQLNRLKRSSQRKRLLFVVSRYRLDWDKFSDRAKEVISTTERYADGKVSTGEQYENAESAHGIVDEAFEMAMNDDFTQASPILANNLRDIFGNPFRPVALDPAWLTSDVLALARGIYEDRAFDRMPIFADALQDAGCDNDDVLNHCRDANQDHVRGCWVVDLVLGKE